MVVSAQSSSISTNQHSFLSSVADAVLVGHTYGTSAPDALLLSCPRTHNINTMSPTVSLAPLILLAATASGKVHEELSGLNHQPLTSAKEAPFKACIDDSDCTVKGTGFACFQYICYPWADDTAIPKKDRYSKSGQNDPINSICCQIANFQHVKFPAPQERDLQVERRLLERSEVFPAPRPQANPPRPLHGGHHRLQRERQRRLRAT